MSNNYDSTCGGICLFVINRCNLPWTELIGGYWSCCYDIYFLWITCCHVTDYTLRCCWLASYPGLLTPVFVACSINAREGLVKLSHLVWRTWTCGGVVVYSCKAAFWIQDTLLRLSDVLRSVVLRSVFAIGSTLTCCFSGNVPLLHKSTYIIRRDSVLPGFPQH